MRTCCRLGGDRIGDGIQATCKSERRQTCEKESDPCRTPSLLLLDRRGPVPRKSGLKQKRRVLSVPCNISSFNLSAFSTCQQQRKKKKTPTLATDETCINQTLTPPPSLHLYKMALPNLVCYVLGLGSVWPSLIRETLAASTV